MAFDPNAAGTRFFINDVGDITWEEVDLGTAGADYGWSLREGPCAPVDRRTAARRPPGLTTRSTPTGHDTGCMSITGGAFVPNGVWPSTTTAPISTGTSSAARSSQLDTGRRRRLRRHPVRDPASAPYSLVSTTFGPSGTGQALYYITLNPAARCVRSPIPGSRAATPGRNRRRRSFVSLVPAYRPCTAASRVHAPPLGGSSCTPAQESSQLTVGTADANGKAPGSGGYTRFKLVPDNMSTPADESDVALALSITDIRRQADLTDYTGAASGRDHDPPDRQVQRPVGDRRGHDDGLLAGLPRSMRGDRGHGDRRVVRGLDDREHADSGGGCRREAGDLGARTG